MATNIANWKMCLSFFLLPLLIIPSLADTVAVTTRCPGLYCGKTAFPDGQYSSCGACVRGSQPDINSICIRCDGSPTFYDWLFLGFMAMLSLVLHWFFIDYSNKHKRSLVVLHLSALVESLIAGLLTLLLADPLGSLEVRSCQVNMLSDWYTMLYNPSPNYTTTLHCTQEIVYPLYTIVMIYYSFSLLLLMLLRPFISCKFVGSRGTRSIYAALYFLPILIIIQAVFGGLVYYAFPYIIIVASVITCAVHLASEEDQTFKDLWRKNFTNIRSLTILIGHWILHAYGIISMTQLKDPTFHGVLIALVPLPALFYIATVKFTDPDNLEKVS